MPDKQELSNQFALACRHGDVKAMHDLIDQGLDPNATGSDGHSPMALVCTQGPSGALRALIKAGGDPNKAAVFEDEDGSHPLLVMALASGRPEEAMILLEAGADLNALCQDGRTLFVQAIEQLGQYDDGACDVFAHALLEAKPDLLLKDAQGLDAIDWALEFGFDDFASHMQMLASTLDAPGAFLGDTPEGLCMEAILRGAHGEAAVLAGRGADPFLAIEGACAIALAACKDHAAAIDAWSAAGVDLDRLATAGDGQRHPLAIAIEHGSVDAAEALLRAWADLDRIERGSPADDGNCLLIQCVHALARWNPESSAALMSTMLAREPNLALKDSEGCSAAEWACNYGMAGIEAMMSDQMARGGKKAPLRVDGPLIKAAKQGDLEGLREALASGESPDQLGLDGMSALASACLSNLDCARTLLQAGADLGLQSLNANGSTSSLAIVAAKGSAESASLLIEAGADLDPGTANGFTPAMLALAESKMDSLALLIDKGADLSKKTLDGADIMDLAKMMGEPALADFIQTALAARKSKAKPASKASMP